MTPLVKCVLSSKEDLVWLAGPSLELRTKGSLSKSVQLGKASLTPLWINFMFFAVTSRLRRTGVWLRHPSGPERKEWRKETGRFGKKKWTRNNSSNTQVILNAPPGQITTAYWKQTQRNWCVTLSVAVGRGRGGKNWLPCISVKKRLHKKYVYLWGGFFFDMWDNWPCILTTSLWWPLMSPFLFAVPFLPSRKHQYRQNRFDSALPQKR